jgi:hypothetical protein
MRYEGDAWAMKAMHEAVASQYYMRKIASQYKMRALPNIVRYVRSSSYV